MNRSSAPFNEMKSKVTVAVEASRKWETNSVGCTNRFVARNSRVVTDGWAFG
jgi:hypothetical protein